MSATGSKRWPKKGALRVTLMGGANRQLRVRSCLSDAQTRAVAERLAGRVWNGRLAVWLQEWRRDWTGGEPPRRVIGWWTVARWELP